MYNIDIISSVFNADSFLEGFFNDLTGQTFFNKCRLILVSPNASPKLIRLSKSVNEIYGNVTLINLESDPGISSCLNLAIKNSNSKYITIANSDDRKRPDSLLRHYLELEACDSIDLVYAPSLLSTLPNETFFINSCKSTYPCYEFSGLDGLIKHNSPHSNPMWKRSIHEKNGYFDESLKSAADGDLWMKCVVNGSVFKMIPEILGLYYLNPKGMSTNRENSTSRLEEESRIKQKYINILNEQKKTSD